MGLTPAEVAELLHVTPQWIRRECAGGRFPGATQVNGRGDWRIPPRAVRLHEVRGTGPMAELMATIKLLVELRSDQRLPRGELVELVEAARELRDEVDRLEEWALRRGLRG